MKSPPFPEQSAPYKLGFFSCSKEVSQEKEEEGSILDDGPAERPPKSLIVYCGRKKCCLRVPRAETDCWR